MPFYALVAAAALAAAVITCLTIVAIAAFRRADSAAVPDVLRELTALVSVLLRRRRR